MRQQPRLPSRTQPITGIFNILATPFDAALNVDEQSLRKLVEFQLDKGVVGLTILGVLGEAAKLSTDERARVADIVFETVNGRVTIFCALKVVRKASTSGATPEMTIFCGPLMAAMATVLG